MIIDSHQHLFTDFTKQISQNKSLGIDKVILFPTIVHPENSRSKDEFTTELNKLNQVLSGVINPTEARINSLIGLSDAIDKSHGYFTGFGSCPFGLSYEETGHWFEKYIVGNNFLGVGEITAPSGLIYMIENIFRISSEQSKDYPLWIHTFNPLLMKDIFEIIRLSEKYPNVKVILGHSAGSNWLETLEIIQNKKSIYMDVSASFTTFSIKYIAETIPERCVFSSDLPYGDPGIGIMQINKIVKDQNVTRKILGENIQELLNI